MIYKVFTNASSQNLDEWLFDYGYICSHFFLSKFMAEMCLPADPHKI